MIAAAQVLIRSLMILAIGPLGLFDVAPGPPVGQDVGLKDGHYGSPTWGYSIRWDSAAWTIAEETSVAGVDTLVLADNRGSSLSFVGLTGFGGDASACLDAMQQAVADHLGGAELLVAQDAQGNPYEMRSPRQSYIVALATRGGGDATDRRAVYNECQPLTPGEAVLQRTFTGSPAVFDQSFEAIGDALDGVFLPASAWIPDGEDPSLLSAGFSPFVGYERYRAAMVLDRDNVPQVLVGQEDESPTARVVTFENVTALPVAVKPSNLTLDLSGFAMPRQVQVPTSIVWEDGVVSGPDGSRTLAPGERATAVVTFDPIDYSRVTCDTLPSLLLILALPDYYPTVAPGDAPSLWIAPGKMPGALNDCFVDDPLPPASGQPVFPTATNPDVTRETLIAAANGQLDIFGRIPLARFTIAPGAAITAAWMIGPLTAMIERGELELVAGENRITVPSGNVLNAESGAYLDARNPGDAPAVLLILWLAPDANWAVPRLDLLPRGITGGMLFPEQDLANRSAMRQFSVERVTLAAGSSVDGNGGAETAAILVETGSVTITTDVGAEYLAAGETRRLAPGATITAGDEGAVVILAAVKPAKET